MPTPDTALLHHLTHTGADGTTTAVVAPAWGANLIGFTFHPNDLLWPISFLETVDIASVAEKPTSYGAPILGPTPGRLGGAQAGVFRFDGREYRMAHPRHGFLRSLPWTVIDRTPSSITCAIDVRPSESLGTFPFDFRAEHRIEIADGQLDAHLSFQSTGSHDQPIGAGWHPYLQREPACRLHIPASSFWELDGAFAEPVPTGRIVPVSGRSDFRQGRLLDPDEHWDLTLTDLAQDDGVASCGTLSETTLLLANGQPARIAVRRAVRSGLANIQLYTAPGRAAIAVEPFSTPPNAVNLLADGHARTGTRRLKRGEATAFDMTLAVLARRA